jgi:hypothetical protein
MIEGFVHSLFMFKNEARLWAASEHLSELWVNNRALSENDFFLRPKRFQPNDFFAMFRDKFSSQQIPRRPKKRVVLAPERFQVS